MRKRIILALSLFLCSQLFAQSSEQTTARYFEKIKDDPLQVLIFLQKMPKGGDLHNHTGGATMAENMIHYALNDSLCVDRKTFAVTVDKQCAPADLLINATKDHVLYDALIDAWSMRNFVQAKQSAHDHFFATFGKYSPISDSHSGEILAEITHRASQQNESYLELMVTPELASSIGDKVGWNADFARLRQALLEPKTGFLDLIKKVSTDLDADEKKQREILACDSQSPMPGCEIKVRYLFQVLREQQPVEVFAQLLAGFEAASRDKRIVGINMVQPEDGFLSMHDYELHMQIVGFLHTLYPNVHITLHAGELNSSLVPPEGLRFHINDAIHVAHAERIGHGVDIAYEENAEQLLREMANKHILVEAGLSSNATILGIEGKNHPLPLYLRYHVPVTLVTDDEGVLRTDLTDQYQKAIMDFHLDYVTIKNLVRNSITYSFLPGKSLWQDHDYKQMDSACANGNLSKTCTAFLQANEKAQIQWNLEQRFADFEKHYSS